MTIRKTQRVNALQRGKEAETDVYKFYAYLDDLGLDAQADVIDEVLSAIRSVNKFLHDLEAIEDAKPLVSIDAPIKR